MILDEQKARLTEEKVNCITSIFERRNTFRYERKTGFSQRHIFGSRGRT